VRSRSPVIATGEMSLNDLSMAVLPLSSALYTVIVSVTDPFPI
jgi:hypothetical protein